MFSAGSYAKIWEIKPEEGKNYTKARISTSVKDKETGNYKQDFGDFVRLVGEAHKKASDLKDGDRFQILKCGVSNYFDKDKQKTYVNYVIFDIEPVEGPEKDIDADLLEGNPFA